MKTLNLLKSLPLVITLASCQHFEQAKSTSAENDPSNRVVATYNGGEVTLKNVNYELSKLVTKNDKIKDLTFDKLNKEQQEALVKEIVIKEIAYKEAKKRGLNKDQDYQEALKLFESDILKQKLLVSIVKEAEDEKNVKKNYAELSEKLKDKRDFKISYIALKTQKEADLTYAIVNKDPKAFSSQAKKKSIDKETAKKGGALDFIMEDSLPTEIVSALKNMQKGEISKPITTGGKWVIVKFHDEKKTEILPYEKAKEALAQNLAKKAIEDFVSQNLDKAKISMKVK